jgi:ATP-dependent 26S proteasome regulatory subunit
LDLFFVFSVAADVKCIVTEAGMSAIRAGQKTVKEKDFLLAIDKVCEKKFNNTSLLTNYN